MSSRSILGLINAVQGLRELGEDPAPVLLRHGIDIDKIDPSTRIDRNRELRMYTEIAEMLNDPTAGLKLGMKFGIASYGPLVMLLVTCANAYESFQVGIKYQQLTYLYSTLSFEPGQGESAVVLTPMPMPPRAFRLRVDGEMSGTYKLLRDMQSTLGMNIHAERIDMPYPAPPEARTYEEHFGCPVRFGQTAGRFWMRNEHLQLRFPTADAAAHAMYRSLCDQQLAAQRATLDTLAERVISHLDIFTETYPSAADVARSFDLSERTFRRQLQDEGTNFRALLGEARYRKAQQLLRQTSLSIEAVAEQLGYAESAAFIRAFKEWSGTTPAAYRAG